MVWDKTFAKTTENTQNVSEVTDSRGNVELPLVSDTSRTGLGLIKPKEALNNEWKPKRFEIHLFAELKRQHWQIDP